MYLSHNELIWMLRQVEGQRVNLDKLIRKFSNHGISSLMPYFDRTGSIFDKSADKDLTVKKLVSALEARINQKIACPAGALTDPSYSDLQNFLVPLLVKSIKRQSFSTLEAGARVSVRLESDASCVKPESEGFITEKLHGASIVRFYCSAGRYGIDTFSAEIPDADLQLLNLDSLLERHQDDSGIAHYFLNDSLLRVMRASIDSSVYSFAANLAVRILAEEGFIKIEANDCVSVPERIFSVLAPRLDETYKNSNLYSSHSLSSPPSERKPHVLRLELTTGCDYNQCSFCTEYSALTPVTKSYQQFREHVDNVVDSIGSEKARIQRLFIGSGNSLGVDTGLLLEALNYASGLFNPQRISLYGRTTSILEKSVDELRRLKEAGLSLIYWGLESGSDEVLRYVCKDCTCEQMIEASKRLVEAEIEVSAMLMPGVGGLKYSEAHLSGSLELLHNIELSYLTLLAVNPGEDSLYARSMKAEKDNRHLTPAEVNAQVYRLLEGLQPTGLQIGMFTEEVDQVSCNSMRFNYQFTGSNKQLLLRDFWN